MSYGSAHVHASDAHILNVDAQDPAEARRAKVKEHARHAREEGEKFWEKVQDKLFQPAVAGGLLSVVNVGIIGALGYQFYTKPEYRTDYRLVGGSALGVFLLLGAEAAAAESYLETEEGQREKERVRREGSDLYRQSKEIILRPGVFGGLLGLINTGVLGTVGYLTYRHWNDRVWDRRYVTGATAVLAAFFAGQGYIAEQYRVNEYPKRK